MLGPLRSPQKQFILKIEFFHLFYNSSKFLEQLLFLGKMHFSTQKRQFSKKHGFRSIFWQYSYNKSTQLSDKRCLDKNCFKLFKIFTSNSVYQSEKTTNRKKLLGEHQNQTKIVFFDAPY